MNIIKKTIFLKNKIVSVIGEVTGRTTNGTIVTMSGSSYVIGVDTNAVYNIKLQLKQDSLNLGDFMSVNESEHTPDIYTVSGICSSRLCELEYYGSYEYSEKYKTNGNILTDGVDYINSVENSYIVYYLSGIKYIDNILDEITYYSFNSGQYVDNFVNGSYIKMPYLGIYAEEKIDNNVNIERQEISVFLDNNKLEYLTSLNKIVTYLGGVYFNIE